MQLFTVPAYFVRNGEIQSEAVDLEESEALVGAVADSETYDSFDYELVSESTTANGDPVFTSKGALSMTGLAYLSTTMAAAATSVLPLAAYPIPDEAPRVGGFVLLGYGDANQEFALVVNQTEAGWTLARGCLDTTPKTWAPGTPAWVINPGAKIVDTQTVHGEGTTATYRGLDRTARGLLGVDDAPAVSTVVTNRPHLPLRPANVKVNGVGFSSVAIGSTATVTVTWATRNRLLEDTQVLRWTDGPVQPEYRQETVVQVYNAATNTLIVEYSALWTESQLVFQKTDFDRFASVRFVVISRRDGQQSLAGHAVTVTGFAQNPSAPLPPGAPPRQEPPSYYPAPAIGAFECIAGAIVGGDGSRSPTLEFSGLQDNLEPTALVVRWRVSGTSDWYRGRPVPLNRERVTFSEAGVPGRSLLNVAIAYLDDGVPGIWRTLPDVTTEALISSDLAPGAPTAVLAAQHTDLIAAEMLRGALYRSYTDGLLHLDGQPVATLFQSLSDQVINELGSFAGTLSLLGSKNQAGTGFIIAADQVFLPATETGGEVTSLRGLQLTTATNKQSIQQLFTLTDGFAESKTLLVVNDVVTGIVNQNDGSIGSLQFQADVFAFVDPNGGNRIAPFSYGVDNILRLTNTIIHGDLVVTGSLTNRALVKNTITGLAVADTSGVVTLTGTTAKTVQSVWIEVKGEDTPVKLLFNGLVLMLHNASGSFSATFEFRRAPDGGQGISLRSRTVDATGDTYDAVAGSYVFTLNDVPGPGVWRYFVTARSTANNMSVQQVTDPYMEAVEYRNNAA